MSGDWLNKLVGTIVLGLIYAGVITSPDQLRGKVDETEYKYMCGATMIENGNTTGITEEEHINDIERILLTSSVIQNRIDSPNWDGNTIEEVIMAKDGGYQQYASVTRNGFKTKKASDIVKVCCKYVMLYGPICPTNVVYQGQSKNGSDVYKRIPVRGDKDEIFCFE